MARDPPTNPTPTIAIRANNGSTVVDGFDTTGSGSGTMVAGHAFCYCRIPMPPYDIRERAFQFARAIVGFYQFLLQETKTPRKLADQLLESGTSIGANLEEAEAAHSKRDFLAKNSNALKEARETRYWLRLLRECKPATPARVEAIITAIRRNGGHRREPGVE